MVDLTNLGGYRMGVSRTHAILELINDELYISDHSSNGTKVNAQPLQKGEKRLLENHSTVSFGELHFHVVIQA
jgi:predicted component of type VI protein secretion system